MRKTAESGDARNAIPAGAEDWQWTITFPTVDVYTTCNRFAYAVALDVDGEDVEFPVPLKVMREEPLDRWE